MNFYLSFIYVIIFLLGKVPPLPQINGYTHWSVTTNGMIVPIKTSFFQMRQPWAIMKLFQQEDNCDFIQTVDLKLNQVSENLKFNHQYQKNVQKIYVDSNSACVKSSKVMAEFDLHSTHILTLEAKGIQSETYLKEEHLVNSHSNEKVQLKEPFCDLYFNRTFSLCCFDHLEAIRNRSSYTGVPEISLYKVALPQHLTQSEFGHLVYMALQEYHSKKTDNWILYNMAAFYWRVKGSAKNAIECLRGALHTSPDKYLDVALVSLSNVLHLIKSTSKDAAILMKNAVFISPHFSSHHIILGNIFASLGEFNESLYHFEMAAKLHRPDKDKTKLKDIEDKIFAARCSHELSIAISAQQSNLNKQMQELKTFQHSTEQYHNAKSSIELERINNETQKRRQQLYEDYINYEEKQIKGFHQCSVYDPFVKEMVICQSFERNIIVPLFKNITSSQNSSGIQKDQYNPTYQRKYKKIHPHIRSKNPGSENAIQSDCKIMKCFNLGSNKNYERYSSIYLSPRNKGFELDNVLTKSQGLRSNVEHPLPWHPPYCMLYIDKGHLPVVEAVDNLETLKRLDVIKNSEEEFPHVLDKVLFVELIKLVNNSKLRLEDIGQRIVTAMTNKLTPLWIVLNIAGLYWRVIGNFLQAIECQRLSAKLSPLQFRDVPIVNLAAILLKLNKTEDSMKLTKSALQIDYSEPATHFLAAGLFKKYENYHLAFQHIDIAIEQEPHLELAEVEWNYIKCQLCIKQETKSTVEEPVVELEEHPSISDLFMKYNMCLSNQECRHIMPNDCYHLPHITISTRGQLLSQMDISIQGGDPEIPQPNEDDLSNIVYGFLWNTDISNIFILEHDCVIINDSVRTAGCYREDVLDEASQSSMKFLAELRSMMQDVSENTSQPVEQKSKINKQSCHGERSDKPSVNDELPSSTAQNSVKLYDDIVRLISARVVLNPLAIEDCEHVAPFDFKTYAPLYVSLNTMQVNVAVLLDSFIPSYSFSFSHQPYCYPKGDNIYLQNILDKHKIDFEVSQYSKVPEYNLHASFLKTFDDKYTLDEIGKRLYVGLEQNASDWRLATIVVNYWRVYGDAKEAFKCLQVAMENSPDYHLKVILVNAANILYRINKYEAALEVSYRALKRPDGHKWIVIPFLVANIFATIEQWQKATLFYEFCLAIKDNFDEAIYRIKSIQCQQMVFKNLEQH